MDVVNHVIGKAVLFSGLDEDAVVALRKSMTEVHLGRGQILFREGETGDRLYVVVEGKIKIGKTAPDGRGALLSIQGPGEMFGELSLFDPGPRTGTATAVTQVRLLALSNAELRPWLITQPSQVALSLLCQLSRRMRRSTGLIADLVFHDVPGRVASTLLDLSERFGVTAADGLHVAHDLTQEELAQLAGASRETVNKTLADFGARGWLRLEGRAVVLLEIERLQRRAGG